MTELSATLAIKIQCYCDTALAAFKAGVPV